MIDDLELTSPVLYLLFRSREFTLCFVSILFFRPSLRREEYYSHKTGTCSRVSKRKCIFPIKTKKNLQNKWWGWFFGCSSSSSGKHSVCPWPTGQFTWWLPAAGPFSALDFDMWCMLFKHDFGENGMSGLHRDLSLSIGLAAMNRFTLGCPTDCIFITDSPVWNRVLYSRQSSEAGQYYSSTRLDAKVPTIFNLDVGRRRRRRKKGQKYCCKIREAIRVD